MRVKANRLPSLETDSEPLTLWLMKVTRGAGAQLSVALENIDIGGHTLLRAAAKNFLNVLPVCDPHDYVRVLEEFGRGDGVSPDTRRRLAAKAFQHCAVYDTHVASYLRPHDDIFPAEYTLALQNRRDRLGVADFEVRGDVGMAEAGRTLADELLPAFKTRYDLVERGQLNQVVGELKLEAQDLNDGRNRAELGRLAKLPAIFSRGSSAAARRTEAQRFTLSFRLVRLFRRGCE